MIFIYLSGISCIDKFIYCDINRICPEAPVPVLQPVHEWENPGMAANVVANLESLGATVDILSAVLSGANYGPWVPPFVAFLDPPADPVGKGIGHFFGAMRIDAFRKSEDFKRDMDLWIRRFRAAEPIAKAQPVIIPGDPERSMEKHRRANGIPLLEVVWQDLALIAEKFNIKF